MNEERDPVSVLTVDDGLRTAGLVVVKVRLNLCLHSCTVLVQGLDLAQLLFIIALSIYTYYCFLSYNA